MIYMAYNEETTELIGWYIGDIHKEIPEPNIEITDEEHKIYYQLMSEHNMKLTVKDGKVVAEKRPIVITWEDIRYSRDLKLRATDWSQARDIPDALAAKYSEYRQDLRNIPQNFESPEMVIWPELSNYGIDK